LARRNRAQARRRPVYRPQLNGGCQPADASTEDMAASTKSGGPAFFQVQEDKSMSANAEAAGQPTIPVICDVCRAEGNAGEEGFEGIADVLNFEPVPRRTQVNNWTPELQRAFIAALAITGSAKRAGKAIGRHEYGAEKLRKARGGKSFSEAWEAALDIYREREMVRLADQMSELSNLSIEQAQAMERGPEESGGDGDEEPGYAAFQEVQERIRDRLLRARRMYLLAISPDDAKRAAWEVLAGSVDWEKAVALQPQDNEPYEPRMREPDMLLTAEGGCLPELTPGGRNRGAEFMEAMDEISETGETDGPKTRRFFDRNGPEQEGERQDG
jgi:hypothetical protein